MCPLSLLLKREKETIKSISTDAVVGKIEGNWKLQRLFSLFFWDILSINVRWESILIFRWNGKNQFYLTCSLTRWLIDQCPFIWLSSQRTLQLFTVHRNCTVAIRVLGHRFIRPIERKRKRRFFFCLYLRLICSVSSLCSLLLLPFIALWHNVSHVLFIIEYTSILRGNKVIVCIR